MEKGNHYNNHFASQGTPIICGIYQPQLYSIKLRQD